MDKNTIIGIVLMLLIVIGFSYINTYPGEETKQTKVEQTNKAKEEAKAAAPAKQEKPETAAVKDTTGLFGASLQGTESRPVLENEKVRIEFNTRGGGVANVWLKEFKNYEDYHAGRENALHLYSDKDARMDFVMETKDENIFLSQYVFNVEASTDSTLTLVLQEADGKRIVYSYTLLPDNYLLNFSMRAEGLANMFSAKTKSISLNWDDRVRQQEKGFYFENMYSTLTYKEAGGDTEKLNEQQDDEEVPEGGVDWIAFKNQYFSALVMAGQSFSNVVLKSKQEQEGSGFLKNYNATADIAFDVTGQKATELQYYFGPNNYRLLRSMDEFRISEKEQDLENLVYLGWPIVKWINRFFTIYVFDWLTQLGLPMGIVLLLITILLRFIVYIPSKKSYLSSAKMRVLKPKIDELNAKYPKPEDAMKKQQEMMSIYSQYGVSPMGGCLPMLVQMPIWIAMFNFVPNAIELRQESFLWADDLSTYDSLISWTTDVPFIGNHLSLFCLLFCVTNIVYSILMMRQQRDSMSAEQAQQMKIMQWMMYLMPVFFFFMFNKYSAGLNYYYFISLLAGALVMWYLRRTTDDAKLLAKLEANFEANKHNPAKRPSGLAARLAALQEQQEELQRRQQKGYKK